MSIVPRTQIKYERDTKQTMCENILFNFLMCPYVYIAKPKNIISYFVIYFKFMRQKIPEKI